MTLHINEEVLKKNNLTIAEYMVLYINCKGQYYSYIKDSLINKGFGEQSMFNKEELVLSNETINLVNTLSVDSATIDTKEEFYESLAKEMQEIYPNGKKAGTTYYWRGSLSEIVHKLKTLEVKHNFKLDREKILEATKNYVESFHGEYRYMSLLKYFILKYDKVDMGGSELKSSLMSIIENGGQVNEDNDEWMIQLK